MEKNKKMTKIRGFEIISFPQWLHDKWNLTVEQLRNVVDKEGIYESYETIKLPKRSTSKSAGYDVYSTVDVTLNPNEDITFPTGWKAYMLEDEKLVFHPRSGLGFKYYIRLANTTGIGDSDYFNNQDNEGHYWVKIRNEGNFPVEIYKGDRVCQCIFEKYLLVDGDSFEDGDVRRGGLGSTSK